MSGELDGMKCAGIVAETLDEIGRRSRTRAFDFARRPCNVARMNCPKGRGPRTLVVLACTVAGMLGSAGCKNRSAQRLSTNADNRGPVVARVDDVVISAADVQERINKQSPFVRARYAELEKRKEFLDNLIRFEIMAKEAEKRGYDHDPEVLRVMKQQMVSKFLQKDFESKLRVEDVPDAEVNAYYKEHAEEFNRPDEVRASQIVVKDRTKAEKIAGEARALDHTDSKAFRELVTRYSEDEDSKARGGDLTSFDRASTLYPKEIVEAAFALKDVGDVSAPVKSDAGFHVLRLTQKHPGFSRPLAEVKRQIQQRLFRDLRTKALDAFVADLRKKYSVSVDEAVLAKLTIDTGGAGAAQAPLPLHSLGSRHAVPNALALPPGNGLPVTTRPAPRAPAATPAPASPPAKAP
jgi:peptidyl-prolyl cis-trans isomerase C